MAVEKSGIRLEAENAAQFLGTLQRGEQALHSFGLASTSAALDVQKLARTSKEIQLDKLNRQLDDQRTRLGIAAQKMGELTAKYGAASIQVQTHEAAMKRLAGQMSETQDRILLTERQIAAEAKAAQEATANNANLEKSMKDLAGEAANASGKIDGMSQIMIGGLRKIGEVGVESLGGLIGTLKDFASASVSTAGDFEASLNRFASVTENSMKAAGLSTKDAKEFFLELGASTQFSASQVSSAANELVKGGVDIKEVMGEATRATLDLAAAGEIDLVPASEIVAKQLGVWGKEAGGATNAVNLLAQSANASTVNVDDLALGLANAGGVAKGAGLSFEDTVTAIGLIAPGFSSASDAGTSFKTFLNSLVPTTKTAKDEMRALGLYTDEAGSAFYDNQGNFIGMEKAAGLLSDATKDLSAEQRALSLELIFGSDAQRAALGLATEGADGWRAFAAEMQATGTAAEQAAKKNQGFNFAVESLGGAVETLMIRLGDKLLPVLTDVINNGLIPLVNWLSTNVGPAIEDFARGAEMAGRGVKVVSEWIGDRFVPALAVATTALGVYATAQAAAFIASTGGIAQTFKSIGLGLSLVINQAPAAALALGPLAVAAAGLVGVVLVIDKVASVQRRIEEGSDAVLQQAQFFQDANAALERFAASSGGAGEESRRLAAEIQAQQVALDELIEAYVDLSSEGDLPADVEKQFLDAIIASKEGIIDKTAALNTSMAADKENNQQIGQSLAGLRDLREGTGQATAGFNEFAGSIRHTDEQLAEFAKASEDARTAGLGVFAEMETSFEGHVSTMAVLQEQYNQSRSDKEREGLQEQMNQQIIAYAEQERLQRESLGRQLITLAEVEGQKAGLSKEKIAQMTAALREEYGIRQTIEEQAWGNSSAIVEEWALRGGANVDHFIGQLGATTDATLETQRSLAELQGEYQFYIKENLGSEVIPDQETFLALMRETPTERTFHLFENFKNGTLSAADFLAQVNRIPSTKTINIHTNYTSSGAAQFKGGAEARAGGGQVKKDRPYRVAEEGWEIYLSRNRIGILGANGEGFFTPPESGHIFSHRDSLAMMRNGQLDSVGRGTMPIGNQGMIDMALGSFGGSSSGIAGGMADLGRQSSTSAAQTAVDMVPWSMRVIDLTKRTTEGSIRGAFDIFKKETTEGFTGMWSDILGGMESQTNQFVNDLGSIFQSPARKSMDAFGQALDHARFQPGINDMLNQIRGGTGGGSPQNAINNLFGGGGAGGTGGFGNALNSLAGQLGGSRPPLGGGFSSMPYSPPASPGQILGGLQFPQPGNTTNHFNLTVQTAPDPRNAVRMGFRQFQAFGGF